MPESIVAYVPVIHQGYLRFFDQYPAADIFILDRELTKNYEPLQKDIRALEPEQIIRSLQPLLPDRHISLATAETVVQLNHAAQKIILPAEDISEQVAGEYFPAAETTFTSIFLRWDRKRTTAEALPKPDAKISQPKFVSQYMNQAVALSQTSADWWRQVGAVLVKDGAVILEAVNRHLPNQQETYMVGDPRANFHKGEKIELSTAMHAEAGLIAQAAQRGLALAGTQLYVTTFPCPVCARLVAESGIQEVFFAEGYAMLDGEEILKNKEIKLTKLESDLSLA